MFTFPDIKTWGRRGTPVQFPVDDSLEAFGSELPTVHSDDGHHRPASSRSIAIILTLLLILATASSGYLLRSSWPSSVEASAAFLTIESDPAGAEVLADGIGRGTTPLTLSLTPGEYAFELVHQGRRKQLKTAARAGLAVVHHVQFDKAAASLSVPQKTASLRIITEPAALRVILDGVARGQSPLTVDDIDPGTHHVQVIGTGGTLERKVGVAAGETASVIISTARPAGPSAGWLTIKSAVALQVIEGEDVIGTSVAPRIMLRAGRHALMLANEALGFSVRRVVQITEGENSSITINLPIAPLSLNAVPWAEAWVDGKRIGETPIGNYLVRIGTHEVVFRHPDLGERRQQVTVTLTAPARLSVDMRQPGS